VPGHPGGGTDFNGHQLGGHLLRLHRRPARLSLVGVRRDGNVLGFVFVHPAAVRGRGDLAGDGGHPVHCNKNAKTTKGRIELEKRIKSHNREQTNGGVRAVKPGAMHWFNLLARILDVCWMLRPVCGYDKDIT